MQAVAQRYGFEPESGVAIAREQISPHASKRGVRRRNSEGREIQSPMLPYHPYLGPVVALVAGILILIQPGLLSVIVAVYLIVTAYLV